MIIDRNALGKPFSLDELLKKFDLKKTDSRSPVLPAGDISDFVIIIGTDLAETLSFDEDPAEAIQDDAVFPEILPPQPRLKKNEE